MATLPRLVGRIRHGRASAAAVAAIVASLIALAGCGGGEDDNATTSASAPAPQVTTPGTFNPGTRSTPTTRHAPETATTVIQALAPFRDCLSRHGVDPEQFRAGLQWQGQQRDPAQVQKQIQAGIACIPELPPRLRQAAERLKRRYEPRTQG
jgi:hypothetical protein